MERELQDVGEGCLRGRGGLKRGYRYPPRDLWEGRGGEAVRQKGFRALSSER